MSAGLAVWREIGDPVAIALGLNHVATTLIQWGRHDEAQAAMEESVELCARGRGRWGLGTAYRYLGLTKMALGQLAEAEALLYQSPDLFSGFTTGWEVARSLTYLGEVTLAAGEARKARGIFLAALREATDAQSAPLALDALLGLASLHALAGEDRPAWELARCVAQHAAGVAETRARATRL